MGNFTSTWLQWQTLQGPTSSFASNTTSTSSTDNNNITTPHQNPQPPISILLDTHQNHVILQWLLLQYLKFHEENVLGRQLRENSSNGAIKSDRGSANRLLSSTELDYLHWNDWVGALEGAAGWTSSSPTAGDASGASTKHHTHKSSPTKGFLSNLQIQDMKDYLDTVTTDSEHLSHRVHLSKHFISSSLQHQDESLSDLTLTQHNHYIFPDNEFIYRLKQTESPQRHVMGYKVPAQCVIQSLHALYLHASCLKQTFPLNTHSTQKHNRDTSSRATSASSSVSTAVKSSHTVSSTSDLLNFIQRYAHLFHANAASNMNISRGDFWGLLQGNSKWTHLTPLQRAEKISEMRIRLYFQALDNFLLTRFTSTKKLQKEIRNLFSSLEPKKTSSTTSTPRSPRTPRNRKVRNIGRTLEHLQSPSVDQSVYHSPSNAKRHEVLVDESRPILSPRLLHEYQKTGRHENRSHSVPPLHLKSPRFGNGTMSFSNVSPSHRLQEVPSSDEEESDDDFPSRPEGSVILPELQQEQFLKSVEYIKSHRSCRETSLLKACQFVQELPLSQPSFQYSLSDSGIIGSLCEIVRHDNLQIALMAADALARLVASNPHIQMETSTELDTFLSVIDSASSSENNEELQLCTLVAHILHECCSRVAVRQALLQFPNSLVILFGQVEFCLSVQTSEAHSRRAFLKQLLFILQQVSLSSMSFQKLHEHNPMRLYNALLDRLNSFDHEFSSEQDTTVSILTPLLGFICNICKERRNVQLANQLGLSIKVFRTMSLYRETKELELIQIMGNLIGRLACKENVRLILRTGLVPALYTWYSLVVDERGEDNSNEKEQLDSTLCALLFALHKTSGLDAVGDIFINQEENQPHLLNATIGFVRIRTNIKDIRCGIHALGFLANLARFRHLAIVLLEKGILGLVCGAALESNVPQYLTHSLHLIRNLFLSCGSDTRNSVFMELETHEAFFQFVKLMTNNPLIRTNVLQTLNAMVWSPTDAKKLGRLLTELKFIGGSMEQTLNDLTMQLKKLKTGSNSLVDALQLCAELSRCISKLMLDDSQLSLFSEGQVVDGILQCMISLQDVAQSLRTVNERHTTSSHTIIKQTTSMWQKAMSGVCFNLALIFQHNPDSVDSLIGGSSANILGCLLDYLAHFAFNGDGEAEEASQWEAPISILRFLSVVCKHDVCAKQITSLANINAVDVLLELMDHECEEIQELAGETLGHTRHHLVGRDRKANSSDS